MRINTATLFYLLLKIIRPQSIYDIGSQDGKDSIRFRQISPNSRIIAFEASPNLYKKMAADKALRKAAIEVYHGAVSNKNGSINFYLEHGKKWRKGISSLRRRLAGSTGSKKVKVPSTRLDDFINRYDSSCSNLALWIDVEGNSFEVLQGLGRLHKRVIIIHLEAETKKFWKGQKLESDIKNLMSTMGFRQLAKSSNYPQHDLLFMNEYYLKNHKTQVVFVLFFAFLLTYIGIIVTGIFPQSRNLISKLDIVNRF